MVTEEDVKAYRYAPTTHADGRNESGQRTWMWAGASRENPRVVLRAHSHEGELYIVDGVPLRNGSPGEIARVLNTQEPKVLLVLDALKAAAKIERAAVRRPNED